MSYEPVPDASHDDVVSAIAEQAKVNGYGQRLATVASWPDAPRHVFFLQLAGSGIGVSGYQQWFPNANRREIEGVLAALQAAGCERVLQLTREMIGLSRDGCGAWGLPRFSAEVDAAWWDTHALPTERKWRTHDHHDEVLPLCHDELWPATDAFIDQHRNELVG